MLIYIPKHAFEVADPRANLDAGVRTVDGKSAEASITINYVRAEPTGDGAGDPTVYSIRRASDPLLPVTAATENVIILLSEQPKEFTKDHVDAANATWVDPVALVAIDEVDPGMLSTGRDDKLYPYVLTITPKYENKNDIVVKVKAFEDMVLPSADTVSIHRRQEKLTTPRVRINSPSRSAKRLRKLGLQDFRSSWRKSFLSPQTDT